jgi:hypothetical protein
MTEYTQAHAQADADALIARLEAEPELRDALVEDPRSTLLGAGLRTDTVDEIVQALEGSEVAGFLNLGTTVGTPQIALNASGTSVIFQSISVYGNTSLAPPGAAGAAFKPERG